MLKRPKSFLMPAILLVFESLGSCKQIHVAEPLTEAELRSASILNLPQTPFDYANLKLPSHFTTNAGGQPLPTSINGTDNTPSNNAITNDGATLGRVLFYDKKLSANGTISCASCHKQEKGFSDEASLSVGFNGGKTRRHSMTLINARFYQRGRGSFGTKGPLHWKNRYWFLSKIPWKWA
jgi:cytochrome c peroxidase